MGKIDGKKKKLPKLDVNWLKHPNRIVEKYNTTKKKIQWKVDLYKKQIQLFHKGNLKKIIGVQNLVSFDREYEKDKNNKLIITSSSGEKDEIIFETNRMREDFVDSLLIMKETIMYSPEISAVLEKQNVLQNRKGFHFVKFKGPIDVDGKPYNGSMSIKLAKTDSEILKFCIVTWKMKKQFLAKSKLEDVRKHLTPPGGDVYVLNLQDVNENWNSVEYFDEVLGSDYEKIVYVSFLGNETIIYSRKKHFEKFSHAQEYKKKFHCKQWKKKKIEEKKPKGIVGVSFRLNYTMSFLVLNIQMYEEKSMFKETNTKLKIENLKDIVNSVKFEKSESNDAFTSHDNIIVAGNFNFRCSVQYDENKENTLKSKDLMKTCSLTKEKSKKEGLLSQLNECSKFNFHEKANVKTSTYSFPSRIFYKFLMDEPKKNKYFTPKTSLLATAEKPIVGLFGIKVNYPRSKIVSEEPIEKKQYAVQFNFVEIKMKVKGGYLTFENNNFDLLQSTVIKKFEELTKMYTRDNLPSFPFNDIDWIKSQVFVVRFKDTKGEEMGRADLKLKDLIKNEQEPVPFKIKFYKRSRYVGKLVGEMTYEKI